MSYAPGVVVLDATFLKHLKYSGSVSRIDAACRVAHLAISPSVPNVLEALNHGNPTIRRELLAAIRRWAENVPLNPWPLDLLRLAGAALPETEFSIGAADIDSLIDRPEELAADHEKVVRFLDDIQARFADAYESNRQAIQDALRVRRLKYAWKDVASFLSSEDWSSPDTQEHLTGVLWELAGLPGTPPPPAIVRQSEVWRLALDAFGAATFIRSVKPDRERRPAGFVDLMQILYLSQHTRARVLITDDASLGRAANGILRGRYINVRVMTASQFLDRAM